MDLSNVIIEYTDKPSTTRYVSINCKEFLLGEVFEILYGLEDTDGLFVTLVINDAELANMLENFEVAFRGTRGSYSKGKNYRAFCKLVGYEFE